MSSTHTFEMNLLKKNISPTKTGRIYETFARLCTYNITIHL